jgi:predicted amidophosphoribosyltransferase
VLDLLLPRRCAICAGGGTDLCDACRAALRPIERPFCERCGLPTAWPVARCRDCAGRRLAFASARSAVVYDEPVRALVAAWKKRGMRGLAAVAAELVAVAVPAPDGTLTFVAPDPNRGMKRGHHPPRALAAALADAWALPLKDLLRRRPGRRQRGLSRADRRRNVRGAFAAASPPARVVLVDDVYTSGATADAAASALRRAGARRVEVVTFARVVR